MYQNDANADSAASFLGYLYIVSQYTVRLMTPCVWRILCLRSSSFIPYFQQPPNLPTTARRNRKCTECGPTAFGRNRMSAESAICPHSAPKPKPKPKFGRPLKYGRSCSDTFLCWGHAERLHHCHVILDLYHRIHSPLLTYTVSKKKPDTCDIFKYLQQICTNINNFWYRESSINLQSSDTKLPCEIS